MSTSRRPTTVQRLALAGWQRVGLRFLPFADAASAELPLGRLLRLSLFQVSVGLALALLNGTLNRVMIVELAVPAWQVAGLVALPILFAPLRALIGHRSDHHASALGWRRVPYLWYGTLLQFGGLAILPFALLVLTGQGEGPAWVGRLGAACAFLLLGAGLHTTQTAGLALATDLATPAQRPRVVALMYLALLLGLVGSSALLGSLLMDYSPLRLVQVVQGAALLTVVLNAVALWKQEARRPRGTAGPASAQRPPLAQAWHQLVQLPRARRLLVAVGLGTAAFSMQDILLEPYGGQVLGLGVGSTSLLTGVWALGGLLAFAGAAHWLQRGHDPVRLAGAGVLLGIWAFAAVIFSEPLGSVWLFGGGALLIGAGNGLFSVALLSEAMALHAPGEHAAHGLALGAWGAVQASAAGLAVALGGALRDTVAWWSADGWLGPVPAGPGTAFSVVYHLEIALLFATLVVLGPLVRRHLAAPDAPTASPAAADRAPGFGLAEFPG